MTNTLSLGWQNKLKKLSGQNIESATPSTMIAASQFIFNPLEENQIVVSGNQQYNPAVLILGRNNSLKISIASTCFDLLRLFAYGSEISKRIVIKQESPIRDMSCVIRPYNNGKPSDNLDLWILLPSAFPSLDESITIIQGNDVQRSYNLTFKLSPDEQGNVAFFGLDGFYSKLDLKIIMGKSLE